MENHILIRYGELSLKKTNRKQFTNRITNHIKRALKEYKDLTFESRGLRFYIMLNNHDSEPIIEILKKIPGLYSFRYNYITDNGSYKLPNGIIVLVDEDYLLYLSGELHLHY